MGCQKDIAKKLQKKQADYSKNNQKDLFENIKTYFFNNPKAKYNFYKDIDKGYGRVEIKNAL